MNDTPTPRTDAALRYCKTRNESGREDMAGYSVLGIQKIIVESKNLECELTAAREELKAVTEQRDRLAEALKRIANNNVQDEPHTCYAYELGRMEGIAKIALAAVKGGGR